MTSNAVPMIDQPRRGVGSQGGQLAFDMLLAVVCLGVTLAINLSGSESVPANRDHDALTVGLTVLAVGSIALRRRWPLGVLLVTIAGVLALVVVKGTVGPATLGPIVAAYTAAAHGSARTAHRAILAVVVALALTWFLDPVDLSGEGAVLTAIVFAAVLLLGTGTRERRDRSVADVSAAEQRVALERERADVERERALQSATVERLRITRELHDVLGHALSVMVVQAGAAGRLLDTDDRGRAREAVAEIERTGRQSMTEMRHLLGILRDGEPGPAASPRRPSPSLEDVDALVARVGEAGLDATVTVRGSRGTVAAGVDLAAYRIVQEALTNCLKHSGATHASVLVDYRTREVEVEVVDDGRGASAVEEESVTGHGVAGMHERVAMYGGDLVVGSRPGGGFSVQATFPRELTP